MLNEWRSPEAPFTLCADLNQVRIEDTYSAVLWGGGGEGTSTEIVPSQWVDEWQGVLRLIVESCRRRNFLAVAR